jgi:flavin-dependent dehydrogenase
VAWQFERAGLDVPQPPEARSAGGAVNHMVGPDGRTGFTLPASATIEVDMRLLNERLLAEARSLGVRLFDRAGTPRVVLDRGRVIELELDAASDGGEPVPHRFDAPLFVDASGRTGVLRRQVPALARWCPDLPAHHLCSASQFTFRVADRDAATRFLDAHGARPGEAVDMLGFAGGFSVLVITVDESLDEVGVLTGTLASDEWGSGRSILDNARAQHSWIGEPLFGGAGLIPLRRPYHRFTAPGLALVGDAASQVFPAHGSGIGIGLIAGTMLAEAVARDGAVCAEEDGDPGAEPSLWDYQAAFMREHGGTLAAYDVLRRLSTRLGSDGVLRMFRAGLFDEATAGAGLDQTWGPPSTRELATQARALAGDPGLAARMAPFLVRTAAAHGRYRRYPEVADDRALRRWARTTDLALGNRP